MALRNLDSQQAAGNPHCQSQVVPLPTGCRQAGKQDSRVYYKPTSPLDVGYNFHAGFVTRHQRIQEGLPFVLRSAAMQLITASHVICALSHVSWLDPFILHYYPFLSPPMLLAANLGILEERVSHVSFTLSDEN